MYIVLDKENAIEQLRSKYLLLELDTLDIPGEGPVTSYAVISSENITLEEVQVLHKLEELHTALMKNYRKKDWNFCRQAIEHLRGKFKGEIDSFYDELEKRINELAEIDLPESWTGNVIVNSE